MFGGQQNIFSKAFSSTWGAVFGLLALNILLLGGCCLFISAVSSTVETEREEWARGNQDHKQEEEEDQETADEEMANLRLSHYHGVKQGMTYEQVVGVLEGRDGREVLSGGNDAYYITTLTWENPDGSNITVTFNKGKVEAKAQFGLSQ